MSKCHRQWCFSLQVDQATAILILLLWRSRSKGIVAKAACRTRLRGELLLCWCLGEERIVPSPAGTHRVDESARSSMLRRNTQVANISKRILTLTSRQKIIKLGSVRILRFLLCLLRRHGLLLNRCSKVLDRVRSRVEVVGGGLLLQCRKCWLAEAGLLWLLRSAGERVV